MKLTRLGHATVLVESYTTRLLIDPGVYSKDWTRLTGLDAVIVTHEHHDHFDRENVLKLIEANPNAAVIGPRSVCNSLRDSDPTEMAPGDSVVLGRTEIEVVGGVHAVVHESIPRVENIGLIVSDPGGSRFFHPGDSYAAIPERIDALALPISSPWSTAGTTADFLNAVAPALAFPIHDAGLSEIGQATFGRIIGRLVKDQVEILSVEGTGSIEV